MKVRSEICFNCKTSLVIKAYISSSGILNNDSQYDKSVWDLNKYEQENSDVVLLHLLIIL